MSANIPGLIPPNEKSRLQALEPYRVLGSMPDAVFDELVRLTAKVFNMPIALISLVDEDHVLFKANYGMAGPERVARQQSMCSVAILQDETSVYHDLQAEPCRLVEPLLVEQLHMRFYAGHPLQTSDYQNIGTLCVIGRDIQFFSVEEQLRLRSLAEVVVDMLELRLIVQQTGEDAPAKWLTIYENLEQYLTRLDTLRQLASWEETPDSEASVAYQRSINEEVDLMIRALKKEVADLWASLTE
ncbi:GAF domain-containing protein [Hymenobacter sp. BT186]|uniref:GAF domain-containing protein n=1 Tax=Hymenobacter telluris TaxID=2816474 RepID=A0A939EVM7_9BACT|nr:GAF domain-containing protein [Hymenobacter telluris]MBO0358051.1 GAF domain-containing protein [Hymenobacter telluris]MBW3374078.1 GAF domain-containing protein [Hymenobacter norwichensis]